MNAVTTDRSGFEELFAETITSSIRDLLGESSMQAILYHLSLERLGRDPQVFDQKLRGLLNDPAAIIEEMIVKDLFKRLDLLYAPSGPFDFQKYVRSAKEVYTQQEKRHHG
jgi:hypothetical protein